MRPYVFFHWFTTRSSMRADRDGRFWFYLHNKRTVVVLSCCVQVLPNQTGKPNRETAHYNFCTHPYNPTRCVLFPLYCIPRIRPILIPIASRRRSAGPPARDPVLAPAPAGKRNAKRQQTQTKRQGGEIRSSRKWYKGGPFGRLFLLLVRGNDAGGAQAYLVRGRRQRRKKTTALKWRDRTAGCAADGSRFRAKRWCRGLA